MDAEMDVTTDGGGAPEPGSPDLGPPEPAPEELAAGLIGRLKAERVQEALAAAELAGRLKAERVQEALGVADLAERLKAERVQEALAAAEFAAVLAGGRETEGGLRALAAGPLARLPADRLQFVLRESAPGWRASADGRTILRRFKFPAVRPAMAFTALVAEVAAAFLHRPEVRIYGDDVLVTFSTPSANGVTLMDIAMARAVDRLPEPPL